MTTSKRFINSGVWRVEFTDMNDNHRIVYIHPKSEFDPKSNKAIALTRIESMGSTWSRAGKLEDGTEVEEREIIVLKPQEGVWTPMVTDLFYGAAVPLSRADLREDI